MASGQPSSGSGTDPSQIWTKAGSSQDANSMSAQGLQSGGNPGQPRPMNQQMVLSDEEKQILRECDSEGFFKRALPISLGAMIGAQMMVKSGRWAGNPKYGALPKALACGGVGYLFGKIMYLPHCQEKILQKIPHSNLAAQVRKSKGLPEPEEGALVNMDADTQSQGKLRDEYSASVPASDLDDRFRPSMDRDVKTPDVPEEEPKKGMSYEELRRRNRQQYEDSRQAPPSSSPSPPSSSPPRTSPSYKDSEFMPQRPWPEDEKKSSPPPEQPQKRKRTNIWGDVIDE